MIMQLSELSEVVGGFKQGMDFPFSSVSTDTRNLKFGDLFIALEGEHFDGNKFVSKARENGAVGALVSKFVTDELPLVVVEDTKMALGNLARCWRQKLDPLLVGVTGSNGKTTTKELIATTLATNGSVLYTQGNLNNDIGVPLTLLRLTEEHNFAVVEMGANHLGEIAYISQIAAPDIAVITNAGPAHLEGFGTVEGVAKAKGEIIESLSEHGTIILNADDRFIGFWKKMAGRRRIISFGFSSKADVRTELSSIETLPGGFGNRFLLEYAGQQTPLHLHLPGRHNISNSLAATAVSIAAGLSLDQVTAGLSSVAPVSGRLQKVRGIAGSTIINDSYNANPSSFQAALEVLIGCPGKHWLILGAFAELGNYSAQFHEKLGQQARAAGIERVFAIGPETQKTIKTFGKGGQHFERQADLIKAVKNYIDNDVIVLIKGSRNQRMDQVVDALAEQISES